MVKISQRAPLTTIGRKEGSPVNDSAIAETVRLHHAREELPKHRRALLRIWRQHFDNRCCRKFYRCVTLIGNFVDKDIIISVFQMKRAGEAFIFEKQGTAICQIVTIASVRTPCDSP